MSKQGASVRRPSFGELYNRMSDQIQLVYEAAGLDLAPVAAATRFHVEGSTDTEPYVKAMSPHDAAASAYRYGLGLAWFQEAISSATCYEMQVLLHDYTAVCCLMQEPAEDSQEQRDLRSDAYAELYEQLGCMVVHLMDRVACAAAPASVQTVPDLSEESTDHDD